MDEFYNNLRSPSWWITAIILAIILGVVSSYFRDFIDAFLSSISKAWSKRTAKKRQERRNIIKSLIGNKEAQLEMTQEEFRSRTNLIYYLIGILYFSLGIMPKMGEFDYRSIETPTAIFMFLFFVIGLSSTYSNTLNLMGIVKAAKEEERELEEIKKAGTGNASVE
jgi:uncharacterized membrane protein YedE/YeeE